MVYKKYNQFMCQEALLIEYFFSNVDYFHNPYNDKVIIIILKCFIFKNPVLTHIGRNGMYIYM